MECAAFCIEEEWECKDELNVMGRSDKLQSKLIWIMGELNFAGGMKISHS